LVQEKRDMLKKGINYILLFSCLLNLQCLDERSSLKINAFKYYPADYLSIRKQANDSIFLWIKELTIYDDLTGGQWELDSMFCFNTNKTRFVACLKSQCSRKECVSDDLSILLGEKIDNKWYFFRESVTIVLPRDLYKKDIHTPLSFDKMHEIAMKEVYKGYLKANGEINEDWFKSHFEGKGWCGEDTCDAKDYEAIHLEKVRNNWAWRDTTIKQELP
jgi:hypothetical protein